MRDVTKYVQSLGYSGETPVQVVDGYVVAPFRAFYPDFCHDLHAKQTKEKIRPGAVVERNVFPRDRERGDVQRVSGNEAQIAWHKSGITSTEWVPHLTVLS